MRRRDIKHIFVGPTGKRTGQTIEYFVDSDELKEMFGKYGNVVDVKIRSNVKDVFAFVHFDESEACGKAIRELNGTILKNSDCKIKVSWGAYNPGEKRTQHRFINRAPPGGYGAAAENGFYPHDEHAPRTVRYEPRQPYATRKYRSRRDHSYSPRRRSRTPNTYRRHRRSPSRSYSNDRTSRRARGRRHSSRSESRGRYRSRGMGNRYATNNVRQSSSPYQRRRTNQERRERFSHSPERRRSHSRGGSPVKRYRLTIEDLPTEMEWEDLKAIGKKYGGANSIVSGKCWSENGLNLGLIEFDSSSSQLKTYDSLHGHRINGHKIRLFLDE